MEQDNDSQGPLDAEIEDLIKANNELKECHKELKKCDQRHKNESQRFKCKYCRALNRQLEHRNKFIKMFNTWCAVYRQNRLNIQDKKDEPIVINYDQDLI